MDFNIDGIVSVLLVPPTMYEGRTTEFSANLKCNELVYFVRSDAVMHLGDFDLHAADGSVVYLPAGEYGRYYVERAHTGTCIDVFFRSDSPELPQEPTVLMKRGGEFLRPHFERAWNAWKKRQPGHVLTVKSSIYAVFAGIEAAAGEDYVSEKQLARLGRADGYLEKMLFSPDFSFDALRSASGLSYTHFHNLFVKKYHTTPQAYVEKRRLQYAKECLEAGGCTVSEAAGTVGYHSVYYFSRVFKAEFGVPPSSFRKE